MCCFLDPRFKALRFLSSSERREVHTSVLTATEELYFNQHKSPPSTKRTKAKPDSSLLDIQGSSDSESSSGNGCSQVHKEFDAYKAERQIDQGSDPLCWWQDQ